MWGFIKSFFEEDDQKEQTCYYYRIKKSILGGLWEEEEEFEVCEFRTKKNKKSFFESFSKEDEEKSFKFEIPKINTKKVKKKV
jgi:hypothetical protein